MNLTLGFSPCPNDTFIFDAMLHGKIDTEGLSFEVVMDDVETLNRLAFEGKIDITKLSYHTFAFLTDKYRLLHAGSALGNHCGPLLITRPETLAKLQSGELQYSELNTVIPGRYTTANFLLSFALPEVSKREELVFFEIENAVLNGTADAGLIIHENRFTYEKRGLAKIMDMGEYWEDTTGYPIPLGGIVVNRQLDAATQAKVNRVMARSVRFALDNPEQTMDFVRAHAQEMEDAVMQSHINLYVNHFTADLGEKGLAAVTFMLDELTRRGTVPPIQPDWLVEK